MRGVLLVTWISNIDYWKTGNQQINVNLVNRKENGTAKTNDKLKIKTASVIFLNNTYFPAIYRFTSNRKI